MRRRRPGPGDDRRAPELTQPAAAHRHHFVFVGGLHRSGTTFLWECLAAHPAVSAFAGTGAPRDEGQWLQSVYPTAAEFGGAARFGFKPEAHLTESSALVSDDSRARLLDEWSRHWDMDKRVLLEKSPPNLIRARFLQALFPEASFVMILRHPIPVSYSIARRFGAGVRLAQLVRHWVACHELLAEDLPHLERVRVVHYERVVAGFADELAGVYAFLGVPYHELRRAPELDRNAGYAPRWSEDPQREEVTRWFDDDVRRFGYSLDDWDLLEPWA